MKSRPESLDAPSADDPRLFRAAQEYLAELEAGRRPNRDEFVGRFPGLADGLAPFLDAIDMVHGASPLAPLSSPNNPAAAAGELLPAEPLGDFRIVREIGRGGMGVVYEAVQRSLGRRVALKVLPFSTALDPKRLQRFKNEAQAAAQLHHTNIVPVYAVGSERGVHYYAMQLIEGQNLAALVENLGGRRTPGGPGSAPSGPGPEPTGPYPPLPPTANVPAVETPPTLGAQLSTQRSDRAPEFFRTVARLAAQAAEGLDYAHGMGIVHRDVKPANLLVDGRGTVWITDFGLAQFHAEGGLTQTGDLLGTLRYMSPEQAGGSHTLIDHRTDVYSLGATLYELLTLRPIFEGTDRRTLLNRIMNDEPRAPRALDRAIPPELETIVLKAIAKAPADRYATAGDFADDLHRFLRYEPIRARRATLIQRVRKWLRRHPAVPVAGAVLLVLLAAGSSVSAWLIRGAYQRERLRAEEAGQQFRLARRSVDELIQVGEEELADKPHLESLRKRLLEAALSYYQEFIEQRQEDPNARADLAATQERVRKILDDLAVLQGAGQLYLLNERDVLEDLRLSEEKRGRIADLSRRLAGQRDESFKTFHRLEPEERRQRFLELARANEKEVADILTPGQVQRLRQIALQLRGPGAFREPYIAAALKLTAGQRERIRTIEAEMIFGPGDRRRSGGPADERQKDHEKRLKEARDRIQAVLTEEQARQWQEMTGEPFRGWAKPFPPPGHFGPPRHSESDPSSTR